MCQLLEHGAALSLYPDVPSYDKEPEPEAPSVFLDDRKRWSASAAQCGVSTGIALVERYAASAEVAL
ncbi:AraC family transcriptional regulator [Anopheles sinensis]|uniref:AraC family transcriptional regulator n=1 Tax=Anopheles sinensis TaxID=74873 RepID=A0A084W411_ANOSI|nr:AraC family transcriptional regulator [Anopheles sinensis]